MFFWNSSFLLILFSSSLFLFRTKRKPLAFSRLLDKTPKTQFKEILVSSDLWDAFITTSWRLLAERHWSV
jgi:hypothetical protein